MYLHIGAANILRTENIIGIFDMDNTTVSKRTRSFLEKAEKKGEVIIACEDLPKSFIVCEEKGEKRVYLSQLSTSTLEKRKNYI